MSPRPRKPGNKDLAGLPLYKHKRWQTYYTKHPLTKRQIALGKDKADAIKLLRTLMDQWAPDVARRDRKRMIGSIKRSIARAAQPPGIQTFADYCREWRLNVLPGLATKGGRSLSATTRHDYERLCRGHIEGAAIFRIPIGLVGIRDVREFLAPWASANKRHMHNYLLAILSRIFSCAIDAALIDKSPVRAIARKTPPKRATYCTDADYAKITAAMAEQGAPEWVVNCVDLIYLLSHSPQDILALKESAIHIEGDTLTVTVRRGKTGETVEITDSTDSDLATLIQGFREWKRQQGIVSPLLICYPVNSKRRGKPISVPYISRRFSAAAAACGFAGVYTLRDLRAKGLTDEALINQATDKGAHRTEAMRRHYVRVHIPKRARNNLRRIR